MRTGAPTACRGSVAEDLGRHGAHRSRRQGRRAPPRPLESVIYVVRGKARMRWGERLEFVAEAEPGDLIYVPPYVRQPLLLQAIARQTRHAGQVTLTISSAHGEQCKARRAYVRIAGFFAQLRRTAEQMDPVQRWYRILSEALRRFLMGRQLVPPVRLESA